MNSAPDFGRLAQTYDELRPVDENWWELFELLVREGELVGRRVLDVGCGTGRFSSALAERGARVWGVDPSSEMLDLAKSRSSSGAGFKRAAAEALPFKDGWFDRAVLRLVAHLVERPRAFAELRRVLAPGEGKLVIASFDPAHFDAFWLNRVFPSLEAVDRARFPTREQLDAELQAAGFGEVRFVPLAQRASVGREQALERIRGRYISTLQMLGEEEYQAGLNRAEQKLPEQVDYALEWLIAVAG